MTYKTKGLTASILKAVFAAKTGATCEMVLDYLAEHYDRHTNVQSIKVLMYNLVQDGLLSLDKRRCSCCGNTASFFRSTDEGLAYLAQRENTHIRLHDLIVEHGGFCT